MYFYVGYIMPRRGGSGKTDACGGAAACKGTEKNVTGSAVSVYFTVAGMSAYPFGYAVHGLLALAALAKGGKAEVALSAGPEAHSGSTYH